MAEATEKKPQEYLEEMEIGFDHGIRVAPEQVYAFRQAATRMKMLGKLFKTELVDGGMNVWRVK